MRSRFALIVGTFALVIGLAGGGVAQTFPNGQSPVVGNWKLLKVETVNENTGEGSPVWMGEKPVGIITYQPNGLMAVQIMKDPKPEFAGKSRLSATPDELKSAFFGYYAYWGTYSVNEAEQTVTHEVTASLWPEEVGSKYKRFIKMDGQRLVLTTPTFTSQGQFAPQGQKVKNQLTWERMTQ